MPDAISVTASAAVSARPAVVPSTTAAARTADLLKIPAKNRRSPARVSGPVWRSIGASTREQETNRIGIPGGYQAITAIFEAWVPTRYGESVYTVNPLRLGAAGSAPRPAALAAEAQLLRHCRALLGVGRRSQRMIARQIPTPQIFGGLQSMPSAEVPTQCL